MKYSAGIVVAWLAGASVLAQTPTWHHVQGGLLEDDVFFNADKGCTAEDGGRIR
jgi:hypothetical protein